MHDKLESERHDFVKGARDLPAGWVQRIGSAKLMRRGSEQYLEPGGVEYHNEVTGDVEDDSEKLRDMFYEVYPDEYKTIMKQAFPHGTGICPY